MKKTKMPTPMGKKFSKKNTGSYYGKSFKQAPKKVK